MFLSRTTLHLNGFPQDLLFSFRLLICLHVRHFDGHCKGNRAEIVKNIIKKHSLRWHFDKIVFNHKNTFVYFKKGQIKLTRVNKVYIKLGANTDCLIMIQ